MDNGEGLRKSKGRAPTLGSLLPRHHVNWRSRVQPLQYRLDITPLLAHTALHC